MFRRRGALAVSNWNNLPNHASLRSPAAYASINYSSSDPFHGYRYVRQYPADGTLCLSRDREPRADPRRRLRLRRRLAHRREQLGERQQPALHVRRQASHSPTTAPTDMWHAFDHVLGDLRNATAPPAPSPTTMAIYRVAGGAPLYTYELHAYRRVRDGGAGGCLGDRACWRSRRAPGPLHPPTARSSRALPSTPNYWLVRERQAVDHDDALQRRDRRRRITQPIPHRLNRALWSCCGAPTSRVGAHCSSVSNTNARQPIPHEPALDKRARGWTVLVASPYVRTSGPTQSWRVLNAGLVCVLGCVARR